MVLLPEPRALDGHSSPRPLPSPATPSGPSAPPPALAATPSSSSPSHHALSQSESTRLRRKAVRRLLRQRRRRRRRVDSLGRESHTHRHREDLNRLKVLQLNADHIVDQAQIHLISFHSLFLYTSFAYTSTFTLLFFFFFLLAFFFLL